MIDSNMSVKYFPFCDLKDFSYFKEKGERLVYTFSQFEQILQFTTDFRFQCTKILVKYQKLKEDKTKFVSEIDFHLFFNK